MNKLGHEGSISYEAWPQYDESKLVDDEVEIVVQLNGKVKAKLTVPADATKEQLEELAKNDARVKEQLEGKNHSQSDCGSWEACQYCCELMMTPIGMNRWVFLFPGT
ncbi:class I tRNA ligase family protein [Bacillus sp. SL00103]